MIRRFEPPCEPPIWARNGQAQTLLGFILPTPGGDLAGGGTRQREVTVSGGDRLVVFDAPPISGHGERPLDSVVVHLFHGLTGSSDSNYVRLSAEALRRAGAEVIAFNHRGQGAGEGLARGIYHSGSAPDLWASIAAGRELRPDALHVGVGFSLSGNALLLGAGRDGDSPGAPDAILAVNPPVDLSRSVGRMERGLNRIYDRRFVLGVRRAMAERRARGELDPSIEVRLRWSLRTTDDRVTAPLAGFGSGAEYYDQCSAAPWIRRVEVPTVILSAEDDPFIESKMIEDAARGSTAFVHMEPVGGHLGYLASGPVAGGPYAEFAGRRWLGAAVAHYVIELSRTASRR